MPYGECWVHKRSTDDDKAVWNDIEGHKSRPRNADVNLGMPTQQSRQSMQSSTEGVWWRVQNEIEALLTEVEEGIDERQEKIESGGLIETLMHQSTLQRTKGECGAPFTPKEHHWEGRWGGFEVADQCKTDGSSSICSNAIDYCGRLKFNLIFILTTRTTAFFPVVYQDNRQWMAMTTSTNVCGARCWKIWDVVGWHPKLLAVKKYWE